MACFAQCPGKCLFHGDGQQVTCRGGRGRRPPQLGGQTMADKSEIKDLFNLKPFLGLWQELHHVCLPSAIKNTLSGKMFFGKVWESGMDTVLYKWVSLSLSSGRSSELCESRGGRPGLPNPNSPYGLCGRKAASNLSWGSFGLWIGELMPQFFWVCVLVLRQETYFCPFCFLFLLWFKTQLLHSCGSERVKIYTMKGSNCTVSLH